MKVNINNYKTINYIQNCNDLKYGINLLESLLIDLAGFNGFLIGTNEEDKMLYIDYIDEHTEYSPERTDPCPDNFGLFRLRFIKHDYDTVGPEMDLNELDTVLCALVNFVEAWR